MDAEVSSGGRSIAIMLDPVQWIRSSLTANAAWEARRRDALFRGPSKVSDARLVILDRPSALAAQARLMQNCLADYKFLPRDGDVVYAVWRAILASKYPCRTCRRPD